MENGVVSSNSVEHLQACTKNTFLKEHGVLFGGIIYYTNPACIDCSWPLQHDTDVRSKLHQLQLAYTPTVVPKQTHTVTYRETGHHELQLDCPRSQCTVIEMECRVKRPGIWTATLHESSQRTNRRALYGFEVHAEGITRVAIHCGGGIHWARSLDATGHVRVDRPGNICWPLWVTFYSGTYLYASCSSKPTLRVYVFDVDEDKGYSYERGTLTSYDFECEDAEPQGGIARFQSGMTAMMLTTGDKELIAKYGAEMRGWAAEENKKTDKERVHSFEVAVLR